MTADDPEAAGERVLTSRHRDAIDAGHVTESWLAALIDRYPDIPAREIEYKSFEQGDGTLAVFWHDHHPVGIAIALRDAMNFTHLTLVESPKPGRTTAISDLAGLPTP